MKAMYQSLSNAVCRVLDSTADTMASAEKAIGDLNHYVEENSKTNRKQITNNAMTRAAENHLAIQNKLDADEKFAAAFRAIEADW